MSELFSNLELRIFSPLIPSRPDVNKIDAGAWFTAHMEHIKPLQNLGYQLFTPSVTTSDDGFKWLTQFMGMCNGNCGVCAIFAIILCALTRPGRSLP
jgi:Glycosyl hydrolase catalytic core